VLFFPCEAPLSSQLSAFGPTRPDRSPLDGRTSRLFISYIHQPASSCASRSSGPPSKCIVFFVTRSASSLLPVPFPDPSVCRGPSVAQLGCPLFVATRLFQPWDSEPGFFSGRRLFLEGGLPLRILTACKKRRLRRVRLERCPSSARRRERSLTHRLPPFAGYGGPRPFPR